MACLPASSVVCRLRLIFVVCVMARQIKLTKDVPGLKELLPVYEYGYLTEDEVAAALKRGGKRKSASEVGDIFEKVSERAGMGGGTQESLGRTGRVWIGAPGKSLPLLGRVGPVQVDGEFVRNAQFDPFIVSRPAACCLQPRPLHEADCGSE